MTYSREIGIKIATHADRGLKTIFRFSDVSVDQVLNNLKQPLVLKSPGIDKIPAKFLNISAGIIAPCLTNIFNLLLHTVIFFSDWKLARVQPMYKSDDRTLYSSSF